jgi:hypothetical protein
MDQPPPLSPKKKGRIWLIVAAGALVATGCVAFGAYHLYHLIAKADFAKGLDQQFGDQDLKSAVALIELHKIRNGRYPQKLADLRYLGSWDAIWTQNVRYVVADDGMSYFVEVQRGWIGKPTLDMPADFWRGTGYNPKLINSRMEHNQQPDPTPAAGAGGTPSVTGDH